MKSFTNSVFILFITLSIFNVTTIKINEESISIKQNQIYAQSSHSFWADFTGAENKISVSGITLPVKFRKLQLNLEEFKNILNTAPLERSANAVNSPLIIELPAPDGKFSKFIVNEYSMMEKGLADQYPEIKTYTIKGIDDPYAVGKIDFTIAGFHSMVMTPNGYYFIDPLSPDNTEIYLSFYKSDYIRKYSFECLVNEAADNSEILNYQNFNMTGQQLRTYRLACAATGEYTAFFGGTVAQGQASIVTAINRVNGVYENEFSVRMVLVANNSLLVYTNSATDPYTNNNGSTMLGQNQTNITSVIGSANYDFGHVFSTGGGGVASLGVICNSSTKSRGVTGLTSPVGDPFYIDYVAHEMGHQFKGNHPFNGNASNCSGGNRNASTAWEPGSGSTIMGYAGICSPQNLQSNSDAYFHSGNVIEITTFTQTGGGNSCPVITGTGNTPPAVTVPAGGFTIPISTPFELTGSATDAETPGSLTYCWEEFDLGATGAPTSPVGDAPIFRSFSPVVSSSRTFPKLSDLLNNTSTIGEILPTYSRNLKFRLTARDNNAGGGGINYDTLSFKVSNTSGPFLVTQPNTAVNWNAGLQTVNWNVANTTSLPVNCALVNIKLSTDGGNTFPLTLISNTANDGSESVSIPNISSSSARIKVESAGNIFFDISNTNFTIVPVPVTCIIGLMSQGMFKNSGSYWTLNDTVRFQLRESAFPYLIADSAITAIANSPYIYDVIFNNALTGNYYLVVRHRNSIETWSNSVNYEIGNQLYVNYIIPGAAYGNNTVQLIPTESWRGIFTGDANQDGIVDANDLSAIANNASNSVTGYVPEDLNGDDIVDAGDVSLVENNVALGVQVVAP